LPTSIGIFATLRHDRPRQPDHQALREVCGNWLAAATLTWDSFFHLNHDDQRRLFAVFADHARVGTMLMFNTGPQHGEAIGDYRGDPLYHASLSPADYRALAARSGFAVLHHAANDPEAGGRTVWLCRRETLPGVTL
jgi:hypothetical protein